MAVDLKKLDEKITKVLEETTPEEFDAWLKSKGYKADESTLAIPEDVEKAAHAFASKPHYKDGTPLSISPMLYMKQGFIAGAKWKAANDPTHAPLPSNIVEQLRLANPYNENWGGLSGTREYEAWVKSVSKLRELLSSQPVQGELVAIGKGLNEMANAVRATAIKEAIHVVGKSLLPHHNVVTPILQEIIKELMTLSPTLPADKKEDNS